jgi:hypothetical protein
VEELAIVDWAFALLGAALVALALRIAYGLGCAFGRQAVFKDAVRHGFAHYEAGKNGEAVFVWNP